MSLETRIARPKSAAGCMATSARRVCFPKYHSINEYLDSGLADALRLFSMQAILFRVAAWGRGKLASAVGGHFPLLRRVVMLGPLVLVFAAVAGAESPRVPGTI